MSAFNDLPPIFIIPLSSKDDVKLKILLFFVIVGSVSVLQDLFQILHAESIGKIVSQLLQFLELSKNLSSYLRFLLFNKIVSSNI